MSRIYETLHPRGSAMLPWDGVCLAVSCRVASLLGAKTLHKAHIAVGPC
jgi:hypothetical protein